MNKVCALRTLSVVVATGFAPVASAQVQLDRFFPPAVSVGGEATIKGEGKFPAWPVEVVCDRDDITVTASKDSGDLKVIVPGDAAPGVAWIRMHDKVSASKLVPLLIEPLKPLAETEPNNKISEATKIELPSVLVGRLEKSGDVDSFRVAVRSDQTLVVSAIAHRILRSPMDAVLQLVDTRGNVILQSDDVRGIDPQLVYDAAQDAELIVRLFAFPETPNSTIGYAGAASFVYSLRVTTGPFVDHVLPIVIPSQDSQAEIATTPVGWNLPDNTEVKHFPATEVSPAVAYVDEALGWSWQIVGPRESTMVRESANGEVVATASGLPFIFSGHIGRPGEVDRVRIPAQKGKKYRASVQSRQLGFMLDSVLRVIDTKSNSELARNDDRDRNDYDATVTYTVKEDAEVELQLSDLVDAFGPWHAYSVVIGEVEPAVELSLAEDHFQVTAGESVTIPVAISRLDGFDRKIRVSAEGLPAGVRFDPVDSEPKGDSAKSVQLKLSADEGAVYQGTFRVVAHALDPDGKQTGESLTAAHSLREIVSIQEIWLTVAPKTPK